MSRFFSVEGLTAGGVMVGRIGCWGADVVSGDWTVPVATCVPGITSRPSGSRSSVTGAVGVELGADTAGWGLPVGSMYSLPSAACRNTGSWGFVAGAAVDTAVTLTADGGADTDFGFCGGGGGGVGLDTAGEGETGGGGWPGFGLGSRVFRPEERGWTTHTDTCIG